MKDIEILDRSDSHYLTVGDMPKFEENGLAIYFLISQFEDIKIRERENLISYKHIAIENSSSKIFVYDIETKTQKALLGFVGRVVSK